MDPFFRLGGRWAPNIIIHPREVTQMLKVVPQRLSPRVVAATTPHKPTELRDPVHGLAKRGWTVRRGWTVMDGTIRR